MYFFSPVDSSRGKYNNLSTRDLVDKWNYSVTPVLSTVIYRVSFLEAAFSRKSIEIRPISCFHLATQYQPFWYKKRKNNKIKNSICVVGL